MNKLNTIFKQIRSNVVVKYFYVMAIFYIPSALSRLFITTDHYFPKVSPDTSNFSTLMNTIFLYRPFPDLFVINLEILCAVLILSIIKLSWLKKTINFCVIILFLNQWYVYFIFFFFNREPNIHHDLFFIKQLPFIINPLLIFCISIFLILLLVLSKHFYRCLQYLFNIPLVPRHQKILSFCVIIALVWFTFLKFELKNTSAKYFYPVQSSIDHIISNINLYKKTLHNQDVMTRKDFNDSQHALAVKPDIFIIMIESYGDIEAILSPKEFNLFKQEINIFNDTLIQNNIYSVSGFSEHRSIGTFGSFQELLLGKPLSYSDIQTLHNSIPETSSYSHLQTFLKSQDFYILNSFSAITNDSFNRFDYDLKQYSRFLNSDSIITLTSLLETSEFTSFSFPDHLLLKRIALDYQASVQQPFFSFIITSNSHIPFYSYDIDLQHTFLDNSVDYNTLSLRLDRYFNLTYSNVNFETLRLQFKDTIIWKFLRFIYNKCVIKVEFFLSFNNLKERYIQALKYQYKSIEYFINHQDDRPYVMILIGDHQPHFINRSTITPVHVLSNKRYLLDYWEKLDEFSPGFHLNNPAITTQHYDIGSHLIKSLQ